MELAFSQKDKEVGKGKEFLGKVGGCLCSGDGQMDGRPSVWISTERGLGKLGAGRSSRTL